MSCAQQWSLLLHLSFYAAAAKWGGIKWSCYPSVSTSCP